MELPPFRSCCWRTMRCALFFKSGRNCHLRAARLQLHDVAGFEFICQSLLLSDRRLEKPNPLNQRRRPRSGAAPLDRFVRASLSMPSLQCNG